jgi:hypothetical protein
MDQKNAVLPAQPGDFPDGNMVYSVCGGWFLFGFVNSGVRSGIDDAVRPGGGDALDNAV